MLQRAIERGKFIEGSTDSSEDHDNKMKKL
jgi:hypothetical protein